MGMRTNKVANAQSDMHPADVIAALHKSGNSLRKIAQAHGYSHINRVLVSPWLAAEQIVATALGVKPEQIWPSRYSEAKSREHAALLTRKVKLTKARRGAVSA